MKKSLKKIVVLAILFVMIGIVGKVNAASVSMSLSSTSKLVAGNTIEVTLKISNINAGEGVDAIQATLNYDRNIFDQVTDDNFEGVNKWNLQQFNVETGQFTATRSSKVNMNSDILKVTLKAKEILTVNSAVIEFKDITTSGGDVESGGTGDVEVQDVKITINKATQIDPSTNKTANETANEQVNETRDPIVNKPNGSGTNTKLPQTGDEYGIVLAIAVVTIVSIIAYVKYRNVNIK